MTPEPLIALVGSPGVGKSSIASCILSRGGQGVIESNKISQISSEDRIWNIDTKYYLARARLLEVCTNHKQQQQPLPEALLLIVDCHTSDSMKALRTWVEGEGANELLHAQVKLLIANKADCINTGSELQRPQWLTETLDWCFEVGLEYVEVCASDPAFDAALEVDGEPHGMARVVEALHAHMWPGMTLKDRRSPTGNRQDVAVAGALVTTSQHHAIESEITTHGNDVVICPDPRDSIESRGMASRLHGEAELPSHLPHDPLSVSQQQQTHKSSGVSLGDGDEWEQHSSDGELEEKQVEAFETIFLEMQGEKQRLSNLPDEDRRAGAAAMAMRLASMLGLDSDEGSEDDGGQNSD